MSDRLKIVIVLKGETASVGVQSPECDPALFSLQGDLRATLKAVPGFVKEAKTRWEASKLNPECETPLPSQAEPVATTSRSSTGSRSQSTTPKVQPTMF
ncbi:MAG: hypothetical protein ACETVS_03125 [Dehalococcoidales bacterium]